jgi:type I restriction enzyme M protein
VPIVLGDALLLAPSEKVDYVLTNPPFGKKSSITMTNEEGEQEEEDLVYNRQDFWATSSNKQLNFLQHINTLLKATGKAAVVVPDNVLFEGGAGETVRKKLIETTDLHTILRLPTGIFYAQGVKTNVLFFTRGTSEKGNTKEVAFYDLRTNQEGFGKTRPLRKSDFEEFIAGYNDPAKRTGERWSKFTREEIEKHEDSLDLGLIRDDSIVDFDDLPDPIESGEEAIAQLEEAVDLLQSVVNELKSLQSAEV